MKCLLVHSVFLVPILFTSLCFIGSVNCQRHCYSCSTQDSNSTCLDIPNNVTEGRVTVPCKYYCTIRRLEYVYIPEPVALISLNRSCEKKPAFLNETVMMDDYFITYYRICRSHLCNFGDGRQSIRQICTCLRGFQDEGEEMDMEGSSSSLHLSTIPSSFSYQFLTFSYLFFTAFSI